VYCEESKKHADTISFDAMSEVLHNTSWLAPKEIKLILRQYAIKFGADEVDYTQFAEDLHKARYELAKCRIMDTSIDQIGPSLLAACTKLDTANAGTISVQKLRVVLLDSNLLMLTPLQINILIGMANPTGDDGLTVEFAPFCENVKDIIENNFTVDVTRRKAQLIQLGQFKDKEVEAYEIGELDLFKNFRDYDENRNQFLELWEYRICIENSL